MKTYTNLKKFAVDVWTNPRRNTFQPIVWECLYGYIWMLKQFEVHSQIQTDGIIEAIEKANADAMVMFQAVDNLPHLMKYMADLTNRPFQTKFVENLKMLLLVDGTRELGERFAALLQTSVQLQPPPLGIVLPTYDTAKIQALALALKADHDTHLQNAHLSQNSRLRARVVELETLYQSLQNENNELTILLQQERAAAASVFDKQNKQFQSEHQATYECNRQLTVAENEIQRLQHETQRLTATNESLQGMVNQWMVDLQAKEIQSGKATVRIKELESYLHTANATIQHHLVQHKHLVDQMTALRAQKEEQIQKSHEMQAEAQRKAAEEKQRIQATLEQDIRRLERDAKQWKENYDAVAQNMVQMEQETEVAAHSILRLDSTSSFVAGAGVQQTVRSASQVTPQRFRKSMKDLKTKLGRRSHNMKLKMKVMNQEHQKALEAEKHILLSGAQERMHWIAKTRGLEDTIADLQTQLLTATNASVTDSLLRDDIVRLCHDLGVPAEGTDPVHVLTERIGAHSKGLLRPDQITLTLQAGPAAQLTASDVEVRDTFILK